jgi:hypothetical protein
MYKVSSINLFTWASPSKIPINTSFTSSGNFIEALSVGDKRVIPFVERAANNTRL